MPDKNKGYERSVITYIISVAINLLYSHISFMFICALGVVATYGHPSYLDLIEFIIVFLVMILINILILMFFNRKKMTYNKVIYWFLTLFFALWPYVVCFIFPWII